MAIKIGIAPDSWGVWFPASDPNNAKQPQWWRCLDEMKIAGYDGCEIGPWGYMPNDNPQVLKNAIDARGLTLVGATEGGNYLDDANVEQMLKDIDDISALLKHFPSAKYIVLLPPMYTNLATGELEMNPDLTDEEWAKYCANVQKCADRCAANGFQGLFHPHVDSHVQTEEQIERFLNDTNVDLCFDTGHHVYGGGEPISFYKKWAKRLTKYYSLMEFYFDPQLFVVGGGVSRVSEKFLPYIDIKTPIVAAKLHNEAGIIGAAYYASTKQK